MKQLFTFLPFLLLLLVMKSAQGSATALSAGYEGQHCRDNTHAFIDKIPFSQQVPFPAEEDDHHMTDFDVVDDAPPQMHQYKPEMSCLRHPVASVLIPGAKDSCHFPHPVYDITSPPPKA